MEVREKGPRRGGFAAQVRCCYNVDAERVREFGGVATARVGRSCS